VSICNNIPNNFDAFRTAKIGDGKLIKRMSGEEEHTIESSLTPFAFPQALITQASLKAMTAMMSTPLLFSVALFSM
jgi:hypothetical protein